MDYLSYKAANVHFLMRNFVFVLSFMDLIQLSIYNLMSEVLTFANLTANAEASLKYTKTKYFSAAFLYQENAIN